MVFRFVNSEAGNQIIPACHAFAGRGSVSEHVISTLTEVANMKASATYVHNARDLQP